MYKLNAFTGSNATLSAHLYQDEELLASQDNVGLYDGKEKSPVHVSGRVHLTSHRLIYIDLAKAHKHSVALNLAAVKGTEYWAGFLKSSAKITLWLGDASSIADASIASTSAVPLHINSSTDSDDRATAGPARAWVCRVCGMQNTSGFKCTLCGVSRDPTSAPSRPATPTSFPTSRTNPPAIPPRPPPPASSTQPRDLRIPCPVCTFLNHPSMTSCEVCSSPLATSLPISTLAALSLGSTPETPFSSSSTPSPSPTPRPSTPNEAGERPYIRLSFRKGGEKDMYRLLKKAMEAREWEASSSSVRPQTTGGGGIDAIMRNMNDEAKTREEGMDDAFQDLDRLMNNAKEMIALAQTLNEKITALESTTAPISTTQTPTATNAQKSLAQSSLQRIGLVNAPVVDSREKTYHQELARELSTVLWSSSGSKNGDLKGKGTMKDGICSLDEVWCQWNRARGVALVAPRDLTLAAPFLQHQAPHPPLHLRTFSSGLTVLHTNQYTLPAFSSRVLSLLDLRALLVSTAPPPPAPLPLSSSSSFATKNVPLSSTSSSSSTAEPRLSSLPPDSNETFTAECNSKENRKQENGKQDGNADGEGRGAQEGEDGLGSAGLMMGATTLEIAQEESLSLGLAREMLDELELQTGDLVRDEQDTAGTRWFRTWQ